MDSLWETPKKDKGGESGDHPEDQTPTEGQGKQGRGRESLSLSALPRVVWQCCQGVLEPRDGCKRCLSGRNRPCTGALSTPQCSGLNWEQLVGVWHWIQRGGIWAVSQPCPFGKRFQRLVHMAATALVAVPHILALDRAILVQRASFKSLSLTDSL